MQPGRIESTRSCIARRGNPDRNMLVRKAQRAGERDLVAALPLRLDSIDARNRPGFDDASHSRRGIWVKFSLSECGLDQDLIDLQTLKNSVDSCECARTRNEPEAS